MKSSLRVAVVFVLITVLIFPAQMMSSSAQEPTNSEISDKLDQMQQTILELSAKVDNLESTNSELINTVLSSNEGVTISSDPLDGGGDEPYRVSHKGNLEVAGLFADCGNFGADFTIVSQEHCRFTVDSIRISSESTVSDSVERYKAICVDQVTFDEDGINNCYNPLTLDIFDLGVGLSPNFGTEASGGGSAFAQFIAGGGVGLGLSGGISFPVKDYVAIETKKIEDLRVGGMVLSDTGVGSILAERFATVGLQIGASEIEITFMGTKPVNMELYFGKAGEEKVTCLDLKGNEIKDDMMVTKTCKDLKVPGTLKNFGNVMRVACLDATDVNGNQGTCQGGDLDDGVVRASSLNSGPEVSASATVQQVTAQQRLFPSPSGEEGPYIDFEITQQEIDKIVNDVAAESGDLLGIAEDMVMKIVNLEKALDMFFKIKDIEQDNLDLKLPGKVLDLIGEIDFDKKIEEVASKAKLPNISQTFTDLEELIDSFDIAPAGFTAKELSKRFGTITEDIEDITGSADDVKDDINRVIADINKFKNSDIDIKIDPPNVNTNSVPSAIKNVVNALCAGGCGWNGKISINPGEFNQNIKEPFKDIFPDIPPIE